MKVSKKITFLLIALLSINVASAQNSMKAPTRFKLKSGLTVLLAENEGMGKIYSQLTLANQLSNNSSSASIIFNGILTKKAQEFNQAETSNPSSIKKDKVTMTSNEANTATNTEEFEKALAFVSNSFFDQEISEADFNAVRLALSSKNKVLASTTFEELQAYQKNSFKTSDVFITIVGDINLSTAKSVVNRVFDNWKAIASL